MSSVKQIAVENLKAARAIANLAAAEGVFAYPAKNRRSYFHLGAVVADAVLQAGLNYSSVVRPRINRIMAEYPDADNVNVLIDIVHSGMASEFLNWKHHVKTNRFEKLVITLRDADIKNVTILRDGLHCERFCQNLLSIKGVGPKTVDYMACLIGIDSIAVDRHVRNFAKQAGIESRDYNFLKTVSCLAADLLAIRRRDFDAWIWAHQSKQGVSQLTFEF
ncbi:hypothetical protein NGM99_17180 [Mesorhizobium sp. RP14(2022)]|uniref:Endonuclease III n=1 Tax=Mesorhizobium liriopis TaxID=2953882 RepID=A0ABT1C9P4_9HYPH|nr:hypothetical protein [Mesorhizobium liriopis]MCO6051520.1 hypothetical protein [Mesorhizobium liriopis]